MPYVTFSNGLNQQQTPITCGSLILPNHRPMYMYEYDPCKPRLTNALNYRCDLVLALAFTRALCMQLFRFLKHKPCQPSTSTLHFCPHPHQHTSCLLFFNRLFIRSFVSHLIQVGQLGLFCQMQ